MPLRLVLQDLEMAAPAIPFNEHLNNLQKGLCFQNKAQLLLSSFLYRMRSSTGPMRCLHLLFCVKVQFYISQLFICVTWGFSEEISFDVKPRTHGRGPVLCTCLWFYNLKVLIKLFIQSSSGADYARCRNTHCDHIAATAVKQQAVDSWQVS
jgi:hypothetical protein